MFANHSYCVFFSGDGKADLIWTDKFNGNGKVYYNLRQAEESERGGLGGSLFEWGRPAEVYLGSSRGPNMHFPSLGGQGRADMVGTNPTTGHVSGHLRSQRLVFGRLVFQERETNLPLAGLDLVQQLSCWW